MATGEVFTVSTCFITQRHGKVVQASAGAGWGGGGGEGRGCRWEVFDVSPDSGTREMKIGERKVGF